MIAIRYYGARTATPHSALLATSDHVKDLSHRDYPLLVDLVCYTVIGSDKKT